MHQLNLSSNFKMNIYVSQFYDSSLPCLWNTSWLWSRNWVVYIVLLRVVDKNRFLECSYVFVLFFLFKPLISIGGQNDESSITFKLALFYLFYDPAYMCKSNEDSILMRKTSYCKCHCPSLLLTFQIIFCWNWFFYRQCFSIYCYCLISQQHIQYACRVKTSCSLLSGHNE